MMGQRQTQNWQNVIWREWRNCRDKAYARDLFELVADVPVGWGTKIAVILLNMIAGVIVGLLIGFFFTSEWAILRQIVWAGGLVGLVRGFLLGRRLSWRAWLNRLAFNLPSSDPSPGLGALFGLSLLGGLVFGPFAWLVLIGLFWVLGGLIQWLNQDQAGGIDPFEYQAWYIWWRARPTPAELETALEAGFQRHPQARQTLRRRAVTRQDEYNS